MVKSTHKDFVFVVGSWIVSFGLTWWFISEFSNYYVSLTFETQTLFYIPLATNLALLLSYHFFNKYWREDAQSWNLVSVMKLCALANLPSEMAQKAEDISSSVVSNSKAAGNASESGLVFTIAFLQLGVYSIATWPSSASYYISVFATILIFILSLVPAYGWVYRPQKEYTIFKKFWKDYWQHVSYLIKLKGENVGLVADKGIPLWHVWMESMEGGIPNEELERLRKFADDLKCNPISLEPDDENYDDILNALYMIEDAISIISKNNDRLEQAKKASSELNRAVYFFEQYMNILQCYKDGTIEKHLNVLRGLEIIAVCPEAYHDLESIRESQTMDDNLDAVDLVSEQMEIIENLPLVVIPSAIKVYIAIVFAILALLPFASLIISFLTPVPSG